MPITVKNEYDGLSAHLFHYDLWSDPSMMLMIWHLLEHHHMTRNDVLAAIAKAKGPQ